jgi:hypothetical protein
VGANYVLPGLSLKGLGSLKTSVGQFPPRIINDAAMKRVIAVIVRLLFLGAFSFGPWPGQTTAGSAACPGKDPIAVVRTYYAAAARHDAAGAQACLTPQYRRKAATFIDPDWKNIAWIRILGFQLFGRLLNDADTETGPAPARLSLVTVSYVVRWKRVGGTADGPGLSFVDLAQAKLSSPWRIEEIGSGG